VSYLAHWIAVLKEDKRAIFAAAAYAQKAVDYLDSLQPNAMLIPRERRMAERAGEATQYAIVQRTARRRPGR
jgi:antirestriction protein ArdC